MSFDTLGLSADLLRAVADRGYTTPTPIQTRSIPLILAGHDVLAGAQTGTGKTAGFTLPLLQRLMHSGDHRDSRSAIRMLILTPTRELAAQVHESVVTYGRYLPLTSAVIFGGVNIKPQIERLRRGVDTLVATPGRLLDHAGQGTVDLSKVQFLVLDEADRMLDMGFIRDIRKILGLLPGKRQNLLFSATFSDDIRRLADTLLERPVSIEVARRNEAAQTVQQRVHPVDRARKRALLSSLITSNGWYRVLVFTRTKHGANRLARQLQQDGLGAAAIHGNKSQSARTRALAEFKQGRLQVLVATDIAARGLDIDQLPQVVNYELPNAPEDYIHRIGRTGRAGRGGEALSLVCVEEREMLRNIEKLLGRRIESKVVPCFEPDASTDPAPESSGRGSGAGRRRQSKQRWQDRATQARAPGSEQRRGPDQPSSYRQGERRRHAARDRRRATAAA